MTDITRRNYVINFYDKLNCLQKKKANGERVVEADFDRAQNVLRLEVQCGYQFIDQLCDELKIENYFGYLFDYNVALIAEAMIYTRVFRYGIEQDFFTYKAAKELLPVKSSAAKKSAILSFNPAKYTRNRIFLWSEGNQGCRYLSLLLPSQDLQR